jgi:hypothetical protein
VGGSVCEIKLHLSKCLMKLSSEGTSAAVSRGEGRDNSGAFAHVLDPFLELLD